MIDIKKKKMKRFIVRTSRICEKSMTRFFGMNVLGRNSLNNSVFFAYRKPFLFQERKFHSSPVVKSQEQYLSKSEVKTKRYNLKIEMALSRKDYDEAVQLFEKMGEEEVEADESSFGLVISACAAKGDDAGYEKYISQMKANFFKPDSSTYTYVIKALAEKGDVEAAEKVFEKMVESHLEPLSSSYNHIMKRYAQDKKLPKMRNWFRRMVFPFHKFFFCEQFV